MLKKKIPEKIRPKMVYKGTKVSNFFSAKDKVDVLHCSNIVYYYKGTGGAERDDYTGETKCRLGKCIQQYQGDDKESAIFQDFKKKNVDPPAPSDFTILGKNYSNRLKRRIAESLFIKETDLQLNIQKDAYQLRLFR